MKNCELCQLPARTFCESDLASLCWDCDSKVHGANFLVARHSRSLLCHACQSPTPWKASGEKLGHTFSVCESCVVRDETRGDDDDESVTDNDDEFDSADDEIYNENALDDFDEDDEDADVDEEGDNQVVPGSSTTPPPPPSSTSSSEEAVGAFNNGVKDGSETATAVSLKRFRETASDLRSEDDLGRSSHQRRYGSVLAAHTGPPEPNDGATLVDSSRPRKDRRIDLNVPGSPSERVIESTMRYCGQDNCKLSEGSVAVDLDALEPRSRRK